MKFSIVITTYNRVELLKRAVDSSLAQTVPCEIIIVDDASSDGTEAYARSLGDRVVYSRNPDNVNHAASVNVGVGLASGDWIKFLDDDDYLAPNCVQVMVAAIAQRPQAVICSSRAISVDEHAQELWRTPITGHGGVFYIPQEAIHFAMLLDMAPMGTPVQVAAQRAAFLKTGGWTVGLPTITDDIDSWFRIAQFGDALFINDCLGYRTLWDGGAVHKFPLATRFGYQLSLKQQMHALLSPRYRAEAPSLEVIEAYLNVNYGVLALKQGEFRAALGYFLRGAGSPQAWRMFGQARAFRRNPDAGPAIPRIPLALGWLGVAG